MTETVFLETRKTVEETFFDYLTAITDWLGLF